MRIKTESLTHIFEEGLPFESVALDSVSFDVQEGEFVGLIGHTGSGKTTLVQHIAGLVKPTSGRVLLDGLDINESSKAAKELRKKVGIVFQYPEYQLFEETVLKDVMFGPKNMGLTEDEAKYQALIALDLVGITDKDKYDASPFALSGGEKRRVAIAGVLAMRPEVLILDEPSAGLDPKGHQDILNMIEKIKNERNLTIFIVSHDMDDVARLCSRVLVMNDGKLVMDASPIEVFSNSDLLKQIGLDKPSAGIFLDMLKAKGIDINSNVLTIEDAALEIINKWQ